MIRQWPYTEQWHLAHYQFLHKNNKVTKKQGIKRIWAGFRKGWERAEIGLEGFERALDSSSSSSIGLATPLGHPIGGSYKLLEPYFFFNRPLWKHLVSNSSCLTPHFKRPNPSRTRLLLGQKYQKLILIFSEFVFLVLNCYYASLHWTYVFRGVVVVDVDAHRCYHSIKSSSLSELLYSFDSVVTIHMNKVCRQRKHFFSTDWGQLSTVAVIDPRI